MHFPKPVAAWRACIFLIAVCFGCGSGPGVDTRALAAKLRKGISRSEVKAVAGVAPSEENAKGLTFNDKSSDRVLQLVFINDQLAGAQLLTFGTGNDLPAIEHPPLQ